MNGSGSGPGTGGLVCRCGCPLDAAAASCPMCDAPTPSSTNVAAEVMERVRQARFKVIFTRPYLARALLRCPVVQTGHVPTVAMDSQWRIYVNPEHVMSSNIPTLAADFVHALFHGLRDHDRRGDVAVRLLGLRDVWHVAACCEINDDLAAEGQSMGDWHLFPFMFDLDNGGMAETYLRELSDGMDSEGDGGSGGESQETDDDQEGGGGGESQETDDDDSDSQSQSDGDGDGQNQNAPKPGIACGSAATGQPQQWELPGDSGEGLSSAEQEIMRRITAEELTEYAKTRGTVSAGLERWADELLHPRVDWRKALASAVKRAVHHKHGRADYTWTRLPRRQRTGPVQRPGMTQPVPDIAVVIDTSGSMSSRDLGHALAEAAGIIRKVVPGEALRVLAVDADVAAETRVFDARRVELVGGGGTDMTVGIAAAAEQRPSAVVVLTDGYTPWPASPSETHGVPVIAGLIGTHSDLRNIAGDVPAWIKTVEIDTSR